MKISDVRVRIVKTDKSKIKASASITIDDCFVVHDIRLLREQKVTSLQCQAEKHQMESLKTSFIHLTQKPEK